MHNEVLRENRLMKKKHWCAWIGAAAELRDGLMPSDPVEGSVAPPHGHPSMETSLLSLGKLLIYFKVPPPFPSPDWA
ncbi:hypothetical protein INR49_005428 [Caranx melampygus]|nr:hypothetical protein INR49_005428 [Caranx melampygus]